MPLNPPQAYRKTQYTHRRGTRADQPVASDVLTGSLYYVTDEALLERSNGTDWETYGQQGSVTSNLVKYTYSSTTTSPPASKQVRFNAAHPYTAVTKLFFDVTTLDSENIRVGLLRIITGSLIYVQDKNDDTKYGTFQTTGVPTDHTTWVEFDVIHYAHGSAIGGGSQVLAQSTWGPTAVTTGAVVFGSTSNLPTFDASKLFWDNTNKRLGIGTNSPSQALHVVGSALISALTATRIPFASTGGLLADDSNLLWDNTNKRLGVGVTPSFGFDLLAAGQDIGYVARFRDNGATGSSWILIATFSGANSQAGFSLFQATNSTEWRFACLGSNGEGAWRVSGNGLDVFVCTLTGNVIINNAITDPTTGTKCLIFGDGTAPSGMDADTAGLFANDVSGTVQMFGVNEAGEYTQLTFGAPQTYTITNVTPDRSYDADSTTLDEIADTLGTLIDDLRNRGIVA